MDNTEEFLRKPEGPFLVTCRSMKSIERRGAVAVLGLALLVRGGMLVAGHASLGADPDDYRRLAENLVAHGTLGRDDRPSMYRPPLYPLVLAGCAWVAPGSKLAIATVHLALGMATVWLVLRAGRRWGLGRCAPVAAVLVACDPILLSQSTLVMTETLAAFLAAASIAALGSVGRDGSLWRAVAAGACLGLAVLCRPTFLPFALAALLVLAILIPSWTGRFRICGMLVLGLCAVLSPWAIRNQVQFGRATVLTSHGGYTLLLGNNPQFYQYLRTGKWGDVWDAQELQQARQPPGAGHAINELQADRLAFQEALGNIGREPGMFAYSCLVRVGRLWSVLPHRLAPDEPAMRRLARYGVGLWYAGELALAAVGLIAWLRRRAGGSGPPVELLWWVLLALGFTAVHALFWTDLRMRAPLMPGVSLTAAAGLAWLGCGAGCRKPLA